MLGLENHHSKIEEQILENGQLITAINDENSELQQTINELALTYGVKLQELARWQRQHQIINDLIQQAKD